MFYSGHVYWGYLIQQVRNYSEAKVTENIDAEIMQVILEEAHEAYDPKIVIELQSDHAEEVETNVERVKEWYETWMKNNNPEELA